LSNGGMRGEEIRLLKGICARRDLRKTRPKLVRDNQVCFFRKQNVGGIEGVLDDFPPGRQGSVTYLISWSTSNASIRIDEGDDGNEERREDCRELHIGVLSLLEEKSEVAAIVNYSI
jgi:hypothetical protein